MATPDPKGRSRRSCAISPAVGMCGEPPLPWASPWLPPNRHGENCCCSRQLQGEKLAHAVLQHSVIYLSRRPGCARTNRTSNKQRVKKKHATDACGRSGLEPRWLPWLRHLQLLCSACHRALLFSDLPQDCQAGNLAAESPVQMQWLHFACLRTDALKTSPAIAVRNVPALKEQANCKQHHSCEHFCSDSLKQHRISGL